MKRIVVAAAVLVSAAVFAFGQLQETVNVNVVEVPVTVVDGNGNPVNGLTAANFELIDNGTKRPITSFDKIDFTSAESMSAVSPLNPVARRNFMLLFDLSNSTQAALVRAQEAARKFVAENVQPRDRVAVGTIEAQKGFRMLTAFTTDRQLVEEAVSQPSNFKGTDPLQLGTALVKFDVPKEGTAVTTNARTDEAARDSMADLQQFAQKNNSQYMRDLAEKEISALAGLATTLRAVPGRKQIVFLSGGFDAKYIQGRDARDLNSDEQRHENEQIYSGEGYKVDTDARYGSVSSMSLLDRMARAFRGSDVFLHAIDIQGIRVQSDVQEGAKLSSNEGLYLLARPTGGEVFKNANDLQMNFERLIHQQDIVYVVGFQAPSQKPGSFHNLKVKLVNVPGSVRLSYRAGYYEAGSETAQERTLSTAEIIVNDIPQSEIRLNALAAAFVTKEPTAEVPVILEANGEDLAKNARGGNLPVEIFIYAFDHDGVIRDRLYQKVGLDLRKVGDKLKSSGLKYYGTLVLPPGNYAIKSLVRVGDTDRRGFDRTDIVVSPPTDVAVSTPIPMDEAPNAVLVKGISHATPSIAPFQLNGDPFIPAATVRRNGGPQKFAVFVHGATADQLTWSTNPHVKYLGRASGADATAMVMEIDPKNASESAIDVTVRRKGATDVKKTSIPIVQ